MTGTGADIFAFAAASLGTNTAGSYATGFNPASVGLSAANVDGFARIA